MFTKSVALPLVLLALMAAPVHAQNAVVTNPDMAPDTDSATIAVPDAPEPEEVNPEAAMAADASELRIVAEDPDGIAELTEEHGVSRRIDHRRSG